MLARIRCAVRGQHKPERQAIGGWRCADCGTPGDSLDDMGYHGSGYVNPLRRTFKRNPDTITRTTKWEDKY